MMVADEPVQRHVTEGVWPVGVVVERVGPEDELARRFVVGGVVCRGRFEPVSVDVLVAVEVRMHMVQVQRGEVVTEVVDAFALPQQPQCGDRGRHLDRRGVRVEQREGGAPPALRSRLVGVRVALERALECAGVR